jgi:hypothetical protein
VELVFRQLGTDAIILAGHACRGISSGKSARTWSIETAGWADQIQTPIIIQFSFLTLRTGFSKPHWSTGGNTANLLFDNPRGCLPGFPSRGECWFDGHWTKESRMINKLR